MGKIKTKYYMGNLSHFESRPGKLSCSPDKVFSFVTDIRNFERFVPQGAVNDWQADKESCSFNVSMIGRVGLRLSGKEENIKVVYNGDALKENDFSLILDISGEAGNPAEVKVTLEADLNPMMKMVAIRPINQFLGTLIDEMERFNGWEDVKG